MKRCPKCRRDYYDESLRYCLDDGNPLLDGPAILSEPGAVATGFRPDDEPQTAILSEPPGSAGGHFGEAPTQTQINTPGKTAILPQVHPHTASTKNSLIAGAIGIVLITALGVGSYWLYGRLGSDQVKSIAVLPFQNDGDLADSEYISDGLAESMIYRLTQIPDLKVSPRTSVFRYKGKEADPEKIGGELGVDAVMTGRLVKRGDNIMISVDLVDVRERRTLWGERFERKMSDLLAMRIAIERGDLKDLKEELGDLLFQVVFHSRMAEEEGAFAFDDVANAIVDKMVRRHPHVFGEASVRSAQEQTQAWEVMKAGERAAKAKTGVLADVPTGLPGLTRAVKLTKRAARVGFDWPTPDRVIEKLHEELDELRVEIQAGNRAKMRDELGDLLFVVANLARKLDIEPEDAIRGTNAKFTRRFAFIEAELARDGRTPEQSDLAEMDGLWDAAKRAEKA